MVVGRIHDARRVAPAQTRGRRDSPLPPAVSRGTLARVSVSIWFWIAFHVGVFAALAIDLCSFRGPRTISLRSAIWRSLVWIALSLAFNAVVWRWQGMDQ